MKPFRKTTWGFAASFAAFSLSACDTGEPAHGRRSADAPLPWPAGSAPVQPHGTGIVIRHRWQLPASLTEISGIALYNGLLACVQDEEGKIFLFDPATGAVEAWKTFAGPGDYEGIAIAGSTAWVLRADGQLYEVRDFAGALPETRMHLTPLTAKQNTEGLFADLPNNRLLIAVKGKDPADKDAKGVYAYTSQFDEYNKDPADKDAKGVYAFDIASGKLLPDPVYIIPGSEAGEHAQDGKKMKKQKNGKQKNGKQKGSLQAQPSEIALHPQSGDLYVLDGTAATLTVIPADGSARHAYELSRPDFPQAEGLAFAPDGDLYISNEGGKGAGTILKVSIE